MISSHKILKTIERGCRHLDVCSLLGRPLGALGKMAGLARVEHLGDGLSTLGDIKRESFYLSKRLLGVSVQDSRVVYGLWKSAPHITTLQWGDTNYHWRDVFGVPVACDQYEKSYWLVSPETVLQIMDRMRAQGDSWIIASDEDIQMDARTTPQRMSIRTSTLVDRLNKFAVPRAQLLWGPPGAGKTVAARQILRERSRLSVTLSPRAATHAEIWDRLSELRPDGILVDDIDSVSDLDGLLDRLEGARDYATTIISTANTIDKLRGALKRPGRASDLDPVLYADLDPETIEAIAPHATPEVRASGLLAAYLAEYEARALAGATTGDDLAELLRRMDDAGDR